jgi:hypothetical protein
MKSLLKASSYIALGMALLIGLQSIPYTADVLAQITSQFVKPVNLGQQANPQSNNQPENSQQIDYAIPTDVNIFNPLGSRYLYDTLDQSISRGYIKPSPVIQDLNGDGLADMIYSYNNGNVKQYVMLNNGHGYDLVYSCEYSGGTWTGDCAANQ